MVCKIAKNGNKKEKIRKINKCEMSLILRVVAHTPVIHKIDFFSSSIESWTESPHTTAARIDLVSKAQITVLIHNNNLLF